MSKTRKTISPEFKAKVAQEAIRGVVTTAELASKYKIHPNQIAKWKKHAQENLASLFADGRAKPKKDDSEQVREQLLQEIGRLQFELSWLKKSCRLTSEQKRSLIDPKHSRLSVTRQCELLDIWRSTFYYEPWQWDENAVEIMNLIDEEYARHPFKGKRQMRDFLVERGWDIGVKRTRTLMRCMGLESVAPKPDLSKPHPHHPKFPYLLKGLKIKAPDMVWASDITYIRLGKGFVYLVAVMDWNSRFVLAWELSTSLENDFCVRCLESALIFTPSGTRRPAIFNTDQGVQYTSLNFVEVLEGHSIRISMDGKGRAFDNIMIERL